MPVIPGETPWIFARAADETQFCGVSDFKAELRQVDGSAVVLGDYCTAPLPGKLRRKQNAPDRLAGGFNYRVKAWSRKPLTRISLPVGGVNFACKSTWSGSNSFLYVARRSLEFKRFVPRQRAAVRHCRSQPQFLMPRKSRTRDRICARQDQNCQTDQEFCHRFRGCEHNEPHSKGQKASRSEKPG